MNDYLEKDKPVLNGPILDAAALKPTPPSHTPQQHNVHQDTISFWVENPNILFNPHYIYELFPTENMSYEQKLNSISRLVIVITIIGFCLSQNIRLLIVAAITLLAIYLLYYYHHMKVSKHRESFREKQVSDISTQINTAIFDPPTSDNPLSNVLLSDYLENPQKKPAPPASNENVSEDILLNAKEMVKRSNPGQPDIADKLFGDLGEDYQFERSMHSFYSMPSTTIPNDQGAFAEFCYGSMISCKEGNEFACARNLPRYNL